MNSANISLTREFSIRRIDETLFRKFAYFSAGPSESNVTENNSKEDILLGLWIGTKYWNVFGDLYP